MFVLIAGGGRTATYLAGMLLAQKHRVCVVEDRPDVLVRIHRTLPTEVIYEGSHSDLDLLEQAGIGEANVIAACTKNDSDNLVLCYAARAVYQVPRTIAWINNPPNAWLFDAKFHVDVALNQAEVLASLIEEEMSMGDMMTLLKLRRGDFSLIEEKLPPGAPAIGKLIRDLPLPENAVIAAIFRDGKIVIPRGDTELLVDDEVLAISDRKAADELAAWFTPSVKPERPKLNLT